MKHTARNIALSSVTAIGILALAACGGSTPAADQATPTPTHTPTATHTPTHPATHSPTATSNGVDPNAPETNPAGDIPDNQAFVKWGPPGGVFSLKVPEGWAQSHGPDGTVFTDKLNSITVVTKSSAKAPTTASVTAALPAIKAESTGWVNGTVSLETRSAGKVVLATYQADAAPDPVTGKVVGDDVDQYTFWKQGQEVTLTLAGPHGADNVDPWRIVTDSFQWK